MSKALHQVFQSALEALTRGEPLEVVLDSFPEHANELRPLLTIAVAASSVEDDHSPAVTAQERSRTRMLQYAATHRVAEKQLMPFWTRLRLSSMALIIIIAILLSSTGIWVASAQSLPGDPFYGIKRRTEELNLSLVSNKSSRYALDIQYRQRRVDEVARLLSFERIEAVNFEAILHEQKEGLWDVGGVLVIVSVDTQLNGPFIVGDEVDIHGITTTSGAVLATSIDLRRYQLIGTVEAQDLSYWVISNRKIDISDALIDLDINLGDIVEVEVEVTHEGIHRALLLNLFVATTTPRTQTDPPEASEDSIDLVSKQRFEGQLDNLNRSTIVVDGQTFRLTDETEIEGVLSPGLYIRVDAAQGADGTWFALEIRVEDLDDDDSHEIDSPDDGKDEDDLNQEVDDDEADGEEDKEEDKDKEESDDEEEQEKDDDD